jgi:uncharacterized membrane protein (DUF485 family)
MSSNKSAMATADEQLTFGVLLAVIQVLVFFGFIYVCIFHSAFLARDVFSIGVPLSFISGLSVIVCGAVLTTLYVLSANRSENQ